MLAIAVGIACKYSSHLEKDITVDQQSKVRVSLPGLQSYDLTRKTDAPIVRTKQKKPRDIIELFGFTAAVSLEAFAP